MKTSRRGVAKARCRPGTLRKLVLAASLALGLAVLGLPAASGGAVGAEEYVSKPVFCPLVARGGGTACPVIAGATYGSLAIAGQPSDRPAHLHADLNLALRGYEPTAGFLGLVDLAGPYDPGAPQLAGLWRPRRVPALAGVFRVYDWDWDAGCRSGPIAEPAVTLVEMATTVGEIVYVPDCGYDIGQGYAALLLYASAERITLKYTRDDNVVQGYTLHIEGLCVEPRLLELYESLNRADRSQLPALREGQPLGRARSARIGVAIRDAGRFMDPRSRKDWWQMTSGLTP